MSYEDIDKMVETALVTCGMLNGDAMAEVFRDWLYNSDKLGEIAEKALSFPDWDYKRVENYVFIKVRATYLFEFAE